MVLTFGELLLRITVEDDFEHQNLVNVAIGGAELNVASNLALWGVPAKYFTALPDTPVAKKIITHLISRSVDVSDIHIGGERIGLYYLTKNQDMKSGGTTYDRKYSSFSMLRTGQLDWGKLLYGVTWFHISGISPALSAETALLCKEALTEAANRNITISIDLNYRPQLWQYGKTPAEVMPELVAYCDVVMGNIWAANHMLALGVKLSADDSTAMSQKVSESIVTKFPKCHIVANTFRLEETQTLNYFGTLYHNGELIISKRHQTQPPVEKVGSGDSFMAGLIYGFRNEWGAEETLQFATAAAFGKLSVPGDCIIMSVSEIQQVIHS